MPLKLGSTSIGSLYLGSTKIGAAYLGNVKVYESAVQLPAYTLRFQFINSSASFDPTQQTWYYGPEASWTHVSGSVWDFNYPVSQWYLGDPTKKYSIFGGSITGYVAGPMANAEFNVIAANMTGVVYAPRLFRACTYMRSICLFDTSHIKEVGGWFEMCRGISYIPDFDFSGVTHENSYSRDFAQFCDLRRQAPTASEHGLLAVPDLTLPSTGAFIFDGMFYNTRYVESGALNLYTNASSIAGSASDCFKNCGSNTTTGAAELAQIPTSWGGTQSA